MAPEQVDSLARLFRRLPAELQLMILHYVTLLEDRCVFQHFPDGWQLCPIHGRGHMQSWSSKMLRNFRIDTYRVPDQGRGTISTSFDHFHERLAHIYLPARSTEYEEIDDIRLTTEYELWKLEYRDNLQEVFLERKHLDRRLDDPNFALIIKPAYLLRSDWAIDNLPFSDNPVWARIMRLSKENGGNQVYPMIRHLMFHTDMEYMDLDSTDFYHLPTYWDDELMVNDRLAERRLEIEHCHGLFLQWDMMPQLESLFLDLRAYTDGATNRHVIKRAASEMSASPSLRLRLLVLAGLRSEHLYPKRGELDIEEVEDHDPEEGFEPRPGGLRPEPNWFRLFRGALRPGGELILIDTQGSVRKRRPYLTINLLPGYQGIFLVSGSRNPWKLHERPFYRIANMNLRRRRQWREFSIHDRLFTESFTRSVSYANPWHIPARTWP